MKKIFLILIMLMCLAPSFVLGFPFLTSEPYPTTSQQPQYFEVNIDGNVFISPAELLEDMSVRLHYDLWNVGEGIHEVSVSACDSGCGDPVSFRIHRRTFTPMKANGQVIIYTAVFPVEDNMSLLSFVMYDDKMDPFSRRRHFLPDIRFRLDGTAVIGDGSVPLVEELIETIPLWIEQ